MPIRLTVGLIALVALLIRLLHVFSYEPIPVSDMAVFVDMATHRLSLQNLFTPAGYCSYPPGYAFFLKPFFLLFDGAAAHRAIQIAQAALGAGTCLLVGRLAARLHSRRAGIVAALVACFFPHYVFYTSVFMSETVFTFFFLAALLLLLRAADRHSAWSHYRAGLAAGFACLVRPAAVALFPAALRAVARAPGGARGRVRAAALLAAGGLTLLLPWAARNAIAYHRFVLIAPNGAINLAIGNTEGASGGYRGLPAIEGDEWERARAWRERAIDFVTRDPFGALFITLRLKWDAFWELVPPWPLYSSNPELFAGRHFFPMIPWAAVLALALVGLVPATRRPAGRMVVLTAAAYVGVYLIFFGQARFRFPIEGIFIALAAAAIVEVSGPLLAAKGRRARAWGMAAAILLVAVLAQSSLSAASARAFHRAPESLLRAGGETAVPADAAEISLFDGGPIPVDRAVARYLDLSFSIRREGPERANPTVGVVHLDFFDAKGEKLEWTENRALRLESVPANRWVTMELKAWIPTAAGTVRATIVPLPSSPDTVVVDRPVLRYAKGNDLALEFLFPYLRAAE
ncbi:MAG: glycosyltransferase family 39 protein [Acidobacteria bacterium]|nr:glycosyltransferase family 39 protein [Acidobacteriota bacterium]